MNLHYFFDHQNNLGDALNGWLWDALLPDRRTRATGTALCGIGTILNHNLPIGTPLAIMGSGIGYGPAPVDRARDWDVIAVRGPLSAHCLGLPPDKAITDGAMLLSLLPEYAACAPLRSGTLFIPHYMTIDGGAWAQACALAGIEFVDPRADSRAILAKIRSAERVIADAMHGAIVADVLRTPWVAASFDPGSASFKWHDWCLSMQLDHQPHPLPESTLFERVRNRASPRNGDRIAPSARGIAAMVQAQRRANRALAAPHRRIATRIARDVAWHADVLERRFAPAAAGRRVGAAAEALRRLATAPVQLSRDCVFEDRRARMAAALRGMATRYGLAVRGDLAL